MSFDSTAWNRLRYSAFAPFYDAFMTPMQALGFAAARRRAIRLLDPQPGARMLLVGAGTGQDLQYLPADARVVATDLSPEMVRRLSRRAEKLGLDVDARVMDGESLSFDDEEFDHVILHLILAVMPDPQACCREVSRVLKPEGTVSIFDKFVADGSSPSAARRAANLFTRTFFTDLTRQLGPILDAGGLEAVQRHEVLSGLFTVAVARKR